MKCLLMTLMLAMPAQGECKATDDEHIFDCCGDIGSENHIRVIKTKNAFTDDAMDILMQIGSNGRAIGVRRDSHEKAVTYQIIWVFPDSERPVFIIDEEHRQLPGTVRAGKLEARIVRWEVTRKTVLAIEISAAEFRAIRENGLAIRVEQTWMEPSYQYVLSYSCPEAWELIGEKGSAINETPGLSRPYGS